MKGKKTRKRHGYKVGHTFYHRNTAQNNKIEPLKYIRLTKQEYEIVTSLGPGVEGSSIEQGGRLRMLRPRVSHQSELQAASENIDTRYIYLISGLQLL